MKESNATSHDSHYNKADHRFGVEAISIMEAIACTGIPEEFWPLCKRNLNLALGFKYEARLGEKDDPDKEMDKAANFRYRARHGFWPWNAKNDMKPVVFGPPPAHLLKTGDQGKSGFAEYLESFKWAEAMACRARVTPKDEIEKKPEQGYPVP